MLLQFTPIVKVTILIAHTRSRKLCHFMRREMLLQFTPIVKVSILIATYQVQKIVPFYEEINVTTVYTYSKGFYYWGPKIITTYQVQKIVPFYEERNVTTVTPIVKVSILIAHTRSRKLCHFMRREMLLQLHLQ